MDYLTTNQIHRTIELTTPFEAKESFYQAAVSYAHMRAEYYLADREKRKEMKGVLLQSDDALIQAWNSLHPSVCELVKAPGVSETNDSDCERIQNFACYLHFIMSVLSREYSGI